MQSRVKWSTRSTPRPSRSSHEDERPSRRSARRALPARDRHGRRADRATPDASRGPREDAPARGRADITIRSARPSDAETIAALTKPLGYNAEPSTVASRLSRLLARSDQPLLVADVKRIEAHAFYERVGYTNLKTQHSFAKSLGPAGPGALRAFVPDVT